MTPRAQQTGLVVTQTPIEVLRREHALTRRMLVLLERLAEHVDAEGEFPASDVAVVLGFFREFVETEHHAKEDACVYPLALLNGGDEEAELVGALVADHDATKELLHSLSLFWEPTGLLEEERRAFCGLARNYARRLDRHMLLEEESLFGLADFMDEAEKARTLAVFEEISAEHRSLESWLGATAELEERWV
jgi:hemerythrin-like domain-containing protein